MEEIGNGYGDLKQLGPGEGRSERGGKKRESWRRVREKSRSNREHWGAYPGVRGSVDVDLGWMQCGCGRSRGTLSVAPLLVQARIFVLLRKIM